jgi:multiple antibiotic resistance protein
MEDFDTIIGKLFPLLFSMMGPIGVIPTFAGLTAKMDPPTRNKVAWRATCLALAALTGAVVMGAGVLQGWGVAPSSLIIAAGLIMTLSVLKTMLSGGEHGSSGAHAPRRPEDIAVSPLAFPTMVSPHGLGVLIIFVAFFPSWEAKLAMLAVALLIMVMNLGAMRMAHWFMARVGMVPLIVLGTVFGVLQVALGIQIIASGLARSMAL